ncbi:DUF4136 domain-containing protein [Ramlibacter rhizophilus]|uniref:DUF4136 domain-containing protein n=2 Tax=Ramlibacter rhizophilus TaxID=1781167 RepID=A0A4Z0BPV6_9BURK|nr:DUF4136 domain-containing protein [Ramlibacter rhizophilus]
MRWGGVVLLLASALLSGCAVGYRLDNAVQSFSSLQALPPSPTYRFEWLPSQRGRPEQVALESFADQALFQAGLRRDDASPRYAVQLDASTQRMLSPWADPWLGWGGGWHPGWGVGLGTGYNRGLALGLGIGGPFFPRNDQIWYHREVRVLLRDLQTNQVVYETRAINDGPWLDSASVFPAMFTAALQGFPTPPPGVRRVDIQVGGKQG